MKKNKIHVQIIQPAVPKYRVPLFESLLEDERFDVFIMSAKAEPGGVRSVASFHKNVDLTHPIKTIFKKLMWQKGLYLLPNMLQGDVLIINGNVKFLSNYPLIWEAKKRNVTVVWWGHGWSSTSSRLSFFVRKFIMKWAADVLLLYTVKEKELFIRNGFDQDKIFYMNNTIDTREINLIKESISQEDILHFKKRHKLEDKKILLFVGRLRQDPPTNLVTAIEALNYLADDKINHYVLIIIGDGNERDVLVKKSKELNLEDRVLFLGAIYDEKELAPWFMGADCFVYPGSIGLSLLHAFSYGLPVVTHDIRTKHGPEIAALNDNVNGSTFIYNDAHDLSNQIKKVINNKESYKHHALQTIQSEYSFQNMIDRVKKCILYSAKDTICNGSTGQVND